MSPCIKIYSIGQYQQYVIFTIVHMEHVTPINQPLALLISFFTVVMKVQVKPSVFARSSNYDIDCLLHLKHKCHIDAAS